MACNVTYRLVHAVGHLTVGRVPGGLTPQLDEVESLSRVHLHHKPDVVGKRHHVLSDVDAQLIVPDMLNRRWGRVINVTTSLDTMYSINGGAYGPSKAALEANTVIMARDLEGSGVSANILVPGGLADTRIVPPSLHASRAALIRPEVMRAPAVWLSSEASYGINGMRFIAARWDPELPLAERIERAGAPAAWPQLGSQSIPSRD